MTTVSSAEHSRRDFLYIATGAVGAVGAAAALVPLIAQMNPDASSIAAGAPVEIDLAPIASGQIVKVFWRSNPIFIFHRTGTSGMYDALSDTFGLPKSAPNRDAVVCWLKLVGSKKGQEAFNPLKGSICARTDCDASLFDDYLQSAMADWKKDAIVPSLAHGAAVKQGWLTNVSDAVTAFVADKNAATLQSRLADACKSATVCK